MLTPEMLEFASKFGFPALIAMVLLYFGYSLLLKPLMDTHIEYVKESKTAIMDVSEAVRDNLEASRRIETGQTQLAVHILEIKQGVGCKNKGTV